MDPTLILAVMAVESSFNPFAQSPVGAQGLMQVMTKVHDDKYEAFGGSHAAFDPVTNLRVGVQVLKECIARHRQPGGGAALYVGAANSGEDGGYAAKVLAQQGILRLVASGGKVRTTAAVTPAPAGAARPAADADAPAPTAEPPAADAGRAPRPRRQDRAPALSRSRLLALHDRARARALRYTGSAVRLAMRLPRAPEVDHHREARSAPAPQLPVEPFAWAAPRAVGSSFARMP